MFYFAGIYKFNKVRVSRNEITRMICTDDDSNINLFTKNNFGIATILPKRKYSCLSFPQFSCNNKKNIYIIFEGRLNNSLELIEYLPHNFDPRRCSYNDIICGLYEFNGLPGLSRLKGIFSFIIWDARKGILILCRDKIGIKPLYYYMGDNSLIFGTFLSAILKSPKVKKEINFERIYNYFMLNGLNLGNQTEYKGIANLIPGNIFILNGNAMRKKKIFCFDNYVSENIGNQETVYKYYEAIKKSIVNFSSLSNKISIAFSGGLDSSVIGATCANNKDLDIDTFTVNYESKSKERKLDYKRAKEISNRFFDNHHELKLTPKLFLNDIGEATDIMGRLINLNYMNNVYIFKWISNFSDLALTGDGVEEQLGSYKYTWFAYYADIFLKKNIEISTQALYNLFYTMLSHRTGWSLSNYFGNKGLFNRSVQKIFDGYDASKIIDECLQKSISSNLLKGKNCFLPSILDKNFWIDFFYFFCPNKLVATDLISRYYNIEIGMPFVDEDFVSDSFKIPVGLKCRGFNKNETKYIFRAAASKLVGSEHAFFNFKSGSDIPYGEWLVDKNFEEYIREVLNPSRVKKSGFLNEKYINKIVNRHFKNRELFAKPYAHVIFKRGKDYTQTILKLISFQLWLEKNIL